MLALPTALFILVMSIVYADSRHAYQTAHEFCPGSYVVQVDERFQFDCEGRTYSVRCDHGECDVELLEKS